MSGGGVFAVDRGVFDHPLFAPEPFTEREAWLWLVWNGPFKKTRKRTFRLLCAMWGWNSETRVRHFIEKLANAGFGGIDDNEIWACAEQAEPAAVRPGSSSWRALRQAVFERDEFTCVYCGAKDPLACDHVIPRSRGGRNEMSNLVTACRPCNSSKRDRLLSEWKQ